MKVNFEQGSLKTINADVIVLFIYEGKDSLSRGINRAKKIVGNKIDHVLELEELKGKEGDLLSVYTDGKSIAPRLLLIGLGEPQLQTTEKIRRGSAAALKKITGKKVRHFAFDLDSIIQIDGNPTEPEASRAIAEGAILSSYRYDKYLSDKKNKQSIVTQISIVGQSDDHAKTIKKILTETKILCETVFLARDLENAPGNEIYPESLASAARTSAEQYGYHIEVWDKKKIEQEQFGGLMAVNSGSAQPPRFVIMEHNRDAKELDTIVLVGKGVTFDAGGISIKPAASMGEMKMDMSGAAAVIGTLEAAARLHLPVHLIGLIPATENLLSGSSMRPGDIITHYGGKTSEVNNTDAEGRLILADALGYASTFKPKLVIDLATLTGACVVALGSHAAGMMGNDEGQMNVLKAAGERTFERVWQLPLFEEYEKQIKSDVADVKNVGGRWGGAITAALFLKKFIGDYQWIHLDIAGTAILEEDFPYAPKGGSGFGIRLLIEFLQQWKKV